LKYKVNFLIDCFDTSNFSATNNKRIRKKGDGICDSNGNGSKNYATKIAAGKRRCKFT
jgi:hypothetical protein